MSDTIRDFGLLPADLSYASIDTALTISDVAYYKYSGTMLTATHYQNLIDAGWTHGRRSWRRRGNPQHHNQSRRLISVEPLARPGR